MLTSANYSANYSANQGLHGAARAALHPGVPRLLAGRLQLPGVARGQPRPRGPVQAALQTGISSS